MVMVISLCLVGIAHALNRNSVSASGEKGTMRTVFLS